MKCGKEEKYEKTKEMKIIFGNLGHFINRGSIGPLGLWLVGQK